MCRRRFLAILRGGPFKVPFYRLVWDGLDDGGDDRDDVVARGIGRERENFRPDDDRREEGPSLAAPWRMDVLAIQTFPP